jgi:cation:H+ antiporter
MAVINIEKVSKLTGLMKFGITMILISVFTSLPEFSIALTSSSAGYSSIAYGSLIGSCILFLFLVLGICIAFYGMKVTKKEVRKTFEIFALSSLLLLFGSVYGFNEIYGLLSIIIFFGFYHRIITSKHEDHKKEDVKELIISSIKLFVSTIIIFLSACVITYETHYFSSTFDLEETIIGATIVSIFTTFPDLSICLTAMRRKQHEIILGDIVGSIFFDSVFALGVISIISSFYISMIQLVLLSILFFGYLMIFAFFKEGVMDRYHGIILLSFFVLYMVITPFLI